MKPYVLFICILCNIIVGFKVFSAESDAQTLNQILQRSLKTDTKSQEIDVDTNIDWLGFIPNVSPWETEINTSVESLWSSEETRNAMNVKMEQEYQAFNLISNVNQRTPYGLSLNVNFERLLNLPEVQGFLFKERINGNVFISLYNDFLGRNTQRALEISEEKNKQLFNTRATLQNCERIANQFFDTFLSESTYKILAEAMNDIKFIQARLSPRAVSPQDLLSLKIDKAQLETRVAQSEQQFKTSQVTLSELTRLEIEALSNLSLDANIDQILKSEELRFLAIDQLNLEIEILKARRNLLAINQGNDISLYSGLRTSKTTPLNDSFSSNLVGINVRWNFGNMQIENSRKSIDFEIARRTIQKDHLINQKAKIVQNFKYAITTQAATLKSMKEATSNADKLQAIAKRNFLNGRIGFFEFLTFRNQVNSVKTEYLQALIDFYRIYLNQSVYLGDAKAACLAVVL